MLTSLVVSCCLHRHHCQCGFFKRARSMSQLLGQEKPATKVQASASPTKSFKRSTLRSPQRRFLGKGSSGRGYITILRYTKKTEHVRQNMIHSCRLSRKPFAIPGSTAFSDDRPVLDMQVFDYPATPTWTCLRALKKDPWLGLSSPLPWFFLETRISHERISSPNSSIHKMVTWSVWHLREFCCLVWLSGRHKQQHVHGGCPVDTAPGLESCITPWGSIFLCRWWMLMARRGKA